MKADLKKCPEFNAFLIFAKMNNTPHKDIDDLTKFSQYIADFAFEEGYKKGYERCEQDQTLESLMGRSEHD